MISIITDYLKKHNELTPLVPKGGGDRPLRTLEAEIAFSLTTGELGRACRAWLHQRTWKKGSGIGGHRDWEGRG